MKQSIFMALAASCLFFASCSKESNTEEQPQTTNKVAINGTDYTTVKIGTQTWTAVNYNGAGGVNYGGGAANDPTIGKLYTLSEAKAITLPTGWRLPSSDDYMKLYTSQGSDSKKVMAKTSWDLAIGTNLSGFNAYAAGYYEVKNTPNFDGKGTDAVFLTTSTLIDYPGIPACFALSLENNAVKGILSDYVVQTSDKGSIRFVSDN